jgi:hypothetical protein
MTTTEKKIVRQRLSALQLAESLSNVTEACRRRGGTLASPTVQTRLEENLHRSLALIAEAYDAEDRGDRKRWKNGLSIL